MQCPDCQSQNLPVKESSSAFGSYISHPRHCCMCGKALTEKCPVCVFHHSKGSKFCVETGANIQLWLHEQSAWKQLKQSLNATLSVRPWKMRLVLALSGLGGILLFLALDAVAMSRGEEALSTVGLCVFAGLVGFVCMAVAGIWMSLARDVRVNRRFAEQKYKVFIQRVD